MVDRSVALEHSSGPQGTRSADARLTPDGDLVIEVQDLGPQVRVWGPEVGEYEFAWTIRQGDVGALVDALLAGTAAVDVPVSGDGDGDVLGLLAARFDSVAEFEQFLRERGIRAEFWSRIGD